MKYLLIFVRLRHHRRAELWAAKVVGKFRGPPLPARPRLLLAPKIGSMLELLLLDSTLCFQGTVVPIITTKISISS